jgi:hypothetical protein
MRFPKTVLIEYDLDSGTASIDGESLRVNDPDALAEIGKAVNTHVVAHHLKQTVIASQLKRGVASPTAKAIPLVTPATRPPSFMPKGDESDDEPEAELVEPDMAKLNADLAKFFKKS